MNLKTKQAGTENPRQKIFDRAARFLKMNRNLTLVST
jgi:hypothetical protein